MLLEFMAVASVDFYFEKPHLLTVKQICAKVTERWYLALSSVFHFNFSSSSGLGVSLDNDIRYLHLHLILT